MRAPGRPRARLIAVLAALTAAAGCGGGHASPFAYDRSAPLDLRDRGVVNRPYPIAIHDVSYASPRGGRVPAYLVVPPGRGPFPAVVYLHGSGGDRLEQLPHATWFAARGAVALTVTAPDARPGAPAPAPGLAGLRAQRALYVQEVVDLRRAVDLLRSLPYVDGKRIAFVGYSAGARMGAVLSAYEPRIRAFDLMSGGGTAESAYVDAAPPEDRKAVRTALDGLVDVDEIAHAHAAFLFQDGLRDTVVPRVQLAALAKAAPRPKQVRWYRAGHALNAQAILDQLAWLSAQLGLDGPVVRGAVTGP